MLNSQLAEGYKWYSVRGHVAGSDSEKWSLCVLSMSEDTDDVIKIKAVCEMLKDHALKYVAFVADTVEVFDGRDFVLQFEVDEFYWEIN